MLFKKKRKKNYKYEIIIGSIIYHLKGYDPDDDPLTFAVKTSIDSDVIQIVNVGKNEADIYLAKELDREVCINV